MEDDPNEAEIIIKTLCISVMISLVLWLLVILGTLGHSPNEITRCASLPEWCAEEMPDLHEVVEAIRDKQE